MEKGLLVETIIEKCRNDSLLNLFHKDTAIHENAISHALDKGYSKEETNVFFQPEFWDVMTYLISTGQYHTEPTEEHYVCKITGNPLSYEQALKKNFVDVRKIYVMNKHDRIVWNAIYQCLYKRFCGLIHERCCSYKKGESTRKVVVRISKQLEKMEKYRGTKHDLTKYFDSVPIEQIDKLFDELESQEPSSIWSVIREFYHDNRIIVNGEMVEKYCSLKQGCAVSAFMSNLILRDVDEFMSHQPVIYYRYSDDCMIIGEGMKAAKAAWNMQQMLISKGLSFNAKKTEYITEKKWVTFLGFKMRKGQVTISKKALENVTHKIKEETIFKCKQKHRALTDRELKKAIDNIQYYFFTGCEKAKAGMASYLFGACNDKEDITMLDNFAKDCIRAAHTNKCDIYGLSASYGEHGIIKGGFDKKGKYHAGRNVAMNLIKTDGLLEKMGWYSLTHMYNKFHQGTDVYKAEIQRMKSGECYDKNL